jgi:hypothetical protein
MGRLPQAPREVRLAVILFLLLLGLADAFGAWEVRNFAAFTPGAVAATVAPMDMEHDMNDMSGGTGEKPIDPGAMDMPHHMIDRQLLVQDSHVHVPLYAITSAFLSLIVFGLALSSGQRVALIGVAFAAPLLDFVGLWGAHLVPRFGLAFGGVTVAGGFAMGLVYLVVLVLAFLQCWLKRPRPEILHAA